MRVVRRADLGGALGGGIEEFVPPRGLLQMHVFDNDESVAELAAAFSLAKHLGCDQGLAIEVHVPPIAETDWLDVLNERAGV